MGFSVEHVELYLRDQLSDSEKLSFEQEMAENTRLRNEVQFQKDMQEAIKMQRKAQLKSRLQNVNVSPVSSSKWMWAAAGLVLAGAIGAGVYYSSNEVKPVIEDTVAVEMAAPVMESLPSQEEATSDLKDAPKPVDVTKNTVAKGNAKSSGAKSDDVVIPSHNLDMNETNDGAVDHSSDKLDNRLSVTETKAIEVKIDDSNKSKFHYQFVNGKLSLFGNFNAQPYELIDFHNGNQKQVYFKFNSKFYLLENNKSVPTPMVKVTDTKLLKKLDQISKR